MNYKKSIGTIVLLLIVSVLITRFVVYDKVNEKLTATENDFVGTYELEYDPEKNIDNAFVYISDNHEFGIYNAYDEYWAKGTWEYGSENNITLYVDQNFYAALIYSYGEYIYVGSDSGVMSIDRNTDAPIIP